MFTLGSELTFQLYSQPTDMRKSFDSLSGIIRNELNQEQGSNAVYVFINKSKNKIKLLHWSSGGLVLYYKRLESGTFELPQYDLTSGSFQLSYTQLVMLIDGISIKNLHQKKRLILRK